MPLHSKCSWKFHRISRAFERNRSTGRAGKSMLPDVAVEYAVYVMHL
jgi:hypothetical protein